MRTSVIVQNLKCGGCANTIKTKLSDIDNITDVVVEVEDSKVAFNFESESDVIIVKDKLRALGYPSIEEENSFGSKAKSFVSCATGKFSS